MPQQPKSPPLQCRGPERRATPWHLLVAVLVVAAFVGGVGLIKLAGPPFALPAAAASR